MTEVLGIGDPALLERIANEEKQLGAYRHIDETGRVTKVHDKAVAEWAEALAKAERARAMPSLEEIGLEIAMQLRGIRKVLERIREDQLGPTPPAPEPKKFPHDAFFDALRKLGYTVRVQP